MNETKTKKMTKVMRCRHCGGPMRLYRDDISCLMCGRSLEHTCERCRFIEIKEMPRKKVA